MVKEVTGILMIVTIATIALIATEAGDDKDKYEDL